MGSQNLPLIHFGAEICNNFDEAISREWLESNGIGGYASSTIAGLNTRRYHGLLVAATKPPVGRMLMVSKLEETLVVGDERFDLSANEYQGAVHPHGFEFLNRFRLDPWPTSVFGVGEVELEKSVFMQHGSNTTLVSYRLLGTPKSKNVALEVRSLVAGRDYHSTTHENGAIRRELESAPHLVSMALYGGVPRVYFAHNAAAVEQQFAWYRNFLFRVERERGMDFLEDLFNPFLLRFDLSKTPSANVMLSTSPVKIEDFESIRRAESQRRTAVANAVPVDDPLVRQLAAAADQFIVKRGDGYTVMAGYPWFTDWGRDTMVSLPGLTLFTGNARIAKGILATFAKNVDQGMLPNRFPDSGEQPEFNTVDATLWYFEAIRTYAAATNDYTFVREELYPVLQSIIDWHIKGTRYNIRMQEDGLLNAGEPGVQLTWMDAKIGDWVVTPRTGKAVEIQALWYNALRTMEEFAGRFGDQVNKKLYANLAAAVEATFNRVFWNEEAGCLYDVVGDGEADDSIRPNQIIAVSLFHSMLPADRARAVVDVVERELLTPYGLRTLSRSHPKYAGHYGGGPVQRDSVYHQGTVWPWLLGPYISAVLRVSDHSESTRKRVLDSLAPIREHLSQAGLGQVSEVFDGDSPHNPGGCFAQAWSIGEIMRALCEGVFTAAAQKAA